MENSKEKFDSNYFIKPTYGISEIITHPTHLYKNLKIFALYFGTIPNLLSVEKMDFNKVKKIIEKDEFGKLVHTISRNDYNLEEKSFQYDCYSFFLESGIMISLEVDDCSLFFISKNRELAEEIFKKIIKQKKIRSKTTEINLLLEGPSGITTQGVQIKKPIINFGSHYNEDFLGIHKQIVKNCNTDNVKGLYLFHGNPGTGKSTYIKYLIHQLRKKVIFISPKMAGNLDNVSMTALLLKNCNSVIVIEDAEELIVSRDDSRNSNLSMLLNLTDGLLGDSLGIQIIATFNTDLKNIDKALLRKGRLTSIYEFKNLTLDRTNFLLKKLGHNVDVDKTLPLAEIFNFDISNNHEPKLRKAVGFGN